MRQILAVALGLVIGITSALAQTSPPKPGSPAANFRDDVLLAKVMTDIRQMRRHELDLLTDELATCGVTSLNEDPAVRRLCEIASQRYQIAYGVLRPISAILFAMRLTDGRIITFSKSPEAEDKAEASKDIRRQVEISGKLSDAIAIRNHELARQIGAR